MEVIRQQPERHLAFYILKKKKKSFLRKRNSAVFMCYKRFGI